LFSFVDNLPSPIKAMALSVTEFLDSSGGLLISLLVLLAVEVASRSGQAGRDGNDGA